MSTETTSYTVAFVTFVCTTRYSRKICSKQLCVRPWKLIQYHCNINTDKHVIFSQNHSASVALYGHRNRVLRCIAVATEWKHKEEELIAVYIIYSCLLYPNIRDQPDTTEDIFTSATLWWWCRVCSPAKNELKLAISVCQEIKNRNSNRNLLLGLFLSDPAQKQSISFDHVCNSSSVHSRRYRLRK